jgi:hypothetical protein
MFDISMCSTQIYFNVSSAKLIEDSQRIYQLVKYIQTEIIIDKSLNITHECKFDRPTKGFYIKCDVDKLDEMSMYCDEYAVLKYTKEHIEMFCNKISDTLLYVSLDRSYDLTNNSIQSYLCGIHFGCICTCCFKFNFSDEHSGVKIYSDSANYFVLGKHYYNYTANYDNNLPYNIINNYDSYKSYYDNDNSLIIKETLLLNQQDRLSYRDSKYFRINQIYEKCVNPPPNGVNAYFFTLDPNTTQPCGSCNMSKFEKIELKMNINPIISLKNPAIFRSYAETYNILRVSNGLCAIMFDR